MPEVQKLGSERSVGVETITSLSTGGYAIAWFETILLPPDENGSEYYEDSAKVAVYDSSGNLLRTDTIESFTFDALSFDFATFFPMEIAAFGSGGYILDYTTEVRSTGFYALYQTIETRDGSGALVDSVDGLTNVPPNYYGDVEIMALTNGNSLDIVYDEATDELIAQIFDGTLTQLGGIIDVTTAPLELNPSFPALQHANMTVATVDGGGFAIAWTDGSTLADGDNFGSAVKIRFFDAVGVATTAQILVNTSINGDQTEASAARLGNGDVIVVWTDLGGNGGDAESGIKAQRFTTAGVKTGGEFIVNTTTAGNQQNASIATLSNGTFVVVWEDRNPGGGDVDGSIRGQLFSSAGVKLGGEFMVNTTAAGVQTNPEVAALSNGRFVVKWQGHTQIFDTDDFDFVAPSITGISASTALEYAANGAVVGTVQATDASALTYALVNNAGGRFAINATTGQIIVADGLLLDFEQAASHMIRVRVTDASSNFTESDFTIAVGNRTPEAVNGDSRGNTFFGGAGVDVFNGLAGNDLLYGADGADLMRGGTGDDRYYVDNAGDQALEFAAQGNDTVFTTVHYALAAGTSIETLRTGNAAGTTPLILAGNAFANTILGNAGNNRIDGGGGADDMRGGGGNDLYYVDNAADKVVEAASGGTDIVVTSVTYALGAGVHAETLQTANALAATAINLTGNELNNVIRGNAGANWIRGNGGADDMYAGADAARDIFIFAAASDSGLGAGMDQVYNFDKANFAGDPNSDKIALNLIDADDDLAGNQAFRFVTNFTAPLAGQAEGQVRIVTVGVYSNIQIDIDGNNTIDMMIQAVGTPGLTVNDLVL